MEVWGMIAAGVQLMSLAVFGVTDADWPQYQHDARHSGFTAEEVHPPYKVAWKYCFLPDRVARRVQAVIYARRVFVGTQHGDMYCFDDVQQVLQMDQFGVCYRENRVQAWPGIMTFIEPTPELGLFLKDHLLTESRALMRRVEEVMPAWCAIYCPCEQTWETSFQPPEDSHQLFMLSSWVLEEKPERLAWLRNVSWLARGDLLYIHKLAETIRAYQVSPD